MNDQAVQEAKEELRAHYRSVRAKTSSEERSAIVRSAVRRLLQTDEWRSAETVALYRAFNTELDVAPLGREAEHSNKRVCYPRCVPNRSLAFVPVDHLTSWITGPFGILEPAGAPLSVANLDLVVVPLIAFDRVGGRLGYGSGYYDRALEGFAGVTVGVAMSGQEARTVPHTDTDLRLNVIVTESEMLRPRVP